MRLEDVSAVIRPRAPWESVDLGCVLAGKHIGRIWKSWCLTVVPLWILLGLLMRNHPVFFCMVVWWLKPLYSRVPLYIVSRALFGAAPSIWEVVKAWPGMLVRRFWHLLFIGRFSPSRCLSLPVGELEGLRKSAYRQRVALLERNGGEGAVMVTMVGLGMKLLVCFTVVVFVIMMVPETVSDRWFSGLSDWWDYSDMFDVADGFYWAIAVVWMLGIMVTEPFYVGAGFALYINSRTLTEGWDIELAFKQMSARLAELKSGSKAGVAALLLGIGLALGGGTPVSAQEGSGAGEREIDRVLAHEDFTVHDRIVEERVSDNSESWLERWLNSSSGSGSSSGGGLPDFFGMIGQIFFYVVLALAVAGLVWMIVKNRHAFMRQGGGGSVEDRPKTKVVMGMDVRPESLPEDVSAAARRAWRDGDSKLALSLLYRGAIAWCVNKAELPIEESDTEGDCVEHVASMGDGSVDAYFGQLTGAWIGKAYGSLEPDDQVMIALCEGWPFSGSVRERGRR